MTIESHYVYLASHPNNSTLPESYGLPSRFRKGPTLLNVQQRKSEGGRVAVMALMFYSEENSNSLDLTTMFYSREWLRNNKLKDISYFI